MPIPMAHAARSYLPCYSPMPRFERRGFAFRIQSGSWWKRFVYSPASETCQIRRVSSMACAIGMDLGIRIGPGQLAASDEFSEVLRRRTDVVRYQRRPGDAA